MRVWQLVKLPPVNHSIWKKVSSNIPRAPSFYQFQVMTSSALLIIIHREQFLGTYTTYPLNHLKHRDSFRNTNPKP